MAENRISLDDIKSIDHYMLAGLVYEILDTDSLLYQKIEGLLLANKPSELHRNIAKRIASIQRGRRFIEYRNSFEFAEEISAIVEDIERLVSDRKEALRLLRKLILTDEKVYGRSDDSGGYIQNSYAYALELWRNYAAKTLSNAVLFKELNALLVLEGYGMRDVLNEAIPAAVLQKLYDQTLHRYLGEEDEFGSYTWKQILQELAHCLKSPEFYLTALHAKGAEIREYEYLDIAKEYRALGDARRTLEHLDQIEVPPRNIRDEYYETLIWAYVQLEEKEKSVAAYRKWYESSKSPTVLLAYLSMLSEAEAAFERQNALDDIEKLSFAQKIDFYMTLEEKALCAGYIRENPEQIETQYMQDATFKETVGWLREEHPQEAILLYRNAVEDALKGSVSKYYPGAIRALEKISVIESRHDTGSWYIESNDTYMDRLVKLHHKKSKFMQLLREAFPER